MCGYPALLILILYISKKIVAEVMVSGSPLAACICERGLKTVTNSNSDLHMAQNIQRGKLYVQEKGIWMTKDIRRDGQVCS